MWTIIRQRSGVSNVSEEGYVIKCSLLEDAKRRESPRLDPACPVHPLSLAVTPDGDYAVWSIGDNILRLLDLSRKEEI